MWSTPCASLFRPPPRVLSLRVHRSVVRACLESRYVFGIAPTSRHASTVDSAILHPSAGTAELVPPPVLRPPERDRYDAAAWMSIVEPLLPCHLRDPSVSSAPPTNLVGIITDAREWANVDLLNHIWSTKAPKWDNTNRPYRWDAAEWLLNSLLDAAVKPVARTSIADIIAPISRASRQTLDGATSSKSDIDKGVQMLQSTVPHGIDPKSSLQQITDSKDRLQDSHSHRVFGQVWYSLGTILRMAMDSSDGRVQSETLLMAARAMSRMRGNAQMSQQSRQTEQLTSLLGPNSEQVSRRHVESVVATLDGQKLGSFTAQQSPAYDLTKMLEYVLWACVSGGWVHEASLLLVPRRNLRRGGSQRSQHLSISSSQSRLDTPQQPKASRLPETERPPLSDSIVTTVIQGILANTCALGGNSQTSPRDIMTDVLRLKRLKSQLEANQLSLGTTSWDSAVARLLEDSHTTDRLNPRFMTSVLGMAGSYGMEGVATNTIGRDGRTTDPSYAFDVSAAAIGLYHQTLQAHVQARDVRGAMDTLTQLQSFTDTNKQHSMRDFLETLADTTASQENAPAIEGGKRMARREHGTVFGGIEYPAYFPNIPPTILASLLNLTTDADMEAVGQWMIHSTEIDGPLIPQSCYSHPKVAAALIRHAAHANDTELLREVTRVQQNDLAGEVLVALAYNFAVKANWKGTLRAIGLSKQYSLHTWSVMDVATIAKALLSHIQSPLQPKSVTGAEFMLQKLLRGDLFLGLGPQGSDLEALAEIVSSIDSNMASLCENMVRPGGLTSFNLPVECFDTLLEGISRSYGSLRAQDLYIQWCTPGQRVMSTPPAQERVDDAGKKQSIAQLFSRPASETRRQSAVHLSPGGASPATFKPRLSTIRIVIDQALVESRSSGTDYVADTVDEGLPTVRASFTELETMEWAAEVLRRDFDMGDGDVDYELQGYLSAQKPGSSSSLDIAPLYHEQTLLMWRALAGSRLTWAQEAEERLRSFASNTLESYMQTEPVAAAERYFLHCLAEEFGFSSQTIGEGGERAVALTKTLAPWHNQKYPVPATRVGDAAERYFAF